MIIKQEKYLAKPMFSNNHYRVRFNPNIKRLPAEWERQECVMVAYPHKKSDWVCCLDDVKKTYKDIIKAISKYEKCLVICDDIGYIKSELKEIENSNIIYTQTKTNDTWIRDYGAIDIFAGDKIISYDFIFNGWGEKFEAKLDNELNSTLYKKGVFSNELRKIDMVLEGGSIDTNGNGMLLTTSKCLLNPNRNPKLSKEQIEKKLKNLFGLDKIIWLKNGSLIGDDTDSHIDTIARFLDRDSIAYVKCYDRDDEHFKELDKMEKELQKTGFKLIPLPLPHPIYHKGERLPATYLNFLFINNALLLPVYNDKYDQKAIEILENFYPKLDIIPIDSTILIREHGSVHCSTMQRMVRSRGEE